VILKSKIWGLGGFGNLFDRLKRMINLRGLVEEVRCNGVVNKV